MFTEQEFEILENYFFVKVYYNVCRNETLNNGTFIFAHRDCYTVSYHENGLTCQKIFTQFFEVIDYINILIKSQFKQINHDS